LRPASGPMNRFAARSRGRQLNLIACGPIVIGTTL
jgi:hypothetical protein